MTKFKKINPRKTQVDLVFTRDFSLFVCEFWRRQLLLKDVKKVWGMSISDQIIHSNGTVVECLRIRQETERLRNFITHLPLSHALFSEKIQFPAKLAVGKLRRIIKECNTVDPDNFYEMWKTCLHLFSRMYPCYMLANFLPGPWAQSFRDVHGKSAEKILEQQFRNRVFYEGMFENADLFLRHLVSRKLATLGNLEPAYAGILRYGEIERLFRFGRVPSLAILKQRKKGFIIIGSKVITGRSLASVLSEHGYRYDFFSNRNIRQITGAVAYRSKTVVGRVRLVFTQGHVNNFPSRAILVAAMTAPNFLPAMKKSAAIVTDEGGLTCHAAITARELRIPTIIATKIATKALNNGDVVKVDTHNGKIEIVKKARIVD